VKILEAKVSRLGCSLSMGLVIIKKFFLFSNLPLPIKVMNLLKVNEYKYKKRIHKRSDYQRD